MRHRYARRGRSGTIPRSVGVPNLRLIVLGVPLASYGVLALTFDEGGGATYVTLLGHRLDAHVTGSVSLGTGIALTAVSLALVRRRGRRPGP